MAGGIDDLMRFQNEALKLRSYRQELIAGNIANADTPNYKAIDIDFAQALRAATAQPMNAASAASPAAAPMPELLFREPGQSSLDGNSVEMDAERAKFADNTIRFEAAMHVLTGQIKAMLAAIQG